MIQKLKEETFDSLEISHYLVSLLLCAEQMTFNIKNVNQIIWPFELLEWKIEKRSWELGYLTNLIEKSVETDSVSSKLKILLPLFFKITFKESIHKILFYQICFLLIEHKAGSDLLSEFFDSFSKELGYIDQ